MTQLYVKSVRSACVLGIVGCVALLGISDFICCFSGLFGCFVGCLWVVWLFGRAAYLLVVFCLCLFLHCILFF